MQLLNIYSIFSTFEVLKEDGNCKVIKFVHNSNICPILVTFSLSNLDKSMLGLILEQLKKI